MLRLRFAPAGLLALLILMAACSSGGTSASATASPTAAASSDAASASTDASASADASTGALPSFDLTGDPELAQRLGDALGGSGQVVSMRGDQFLATSSDASLQDFLDGVGAEPSDMSVAFGATSTGSAVYAIRILGTTESQLQEKFLGSVGSGMDGGTEATVGGKQVVTLDAGAAGSTFFLYFKDDTVYWLIGSQTDAEAILPNFP